MTEPRLTDDRIATALRTHLPAHARAGLATSVMDAVDRTPQQAQPPRVLRAVSDTDPRARQWTLLIAAALLVGLLLASAFAVGGMRILERDRVPIDLAPPAVVQLDPPADVAALVLSTYDRMPTMPPATISTLEDGSTKGRIYVGASGAVRIERFGSADATEPVTFDILAGTTKAGLVAIGSDRYWVSQEDAISEDPRVFLLPELMGSGAGAGVGCGVTRDEGEVGDGIAADGWAYVGAEAILGRPAYHVTCAGGDLWIDPETRLILRSEGPARDADFQLIPGSTRTIEVTALEFGDPPADRFALTAPAGVAGLSPEEYQCRLDPATCQPSPTPTPIASAQPASGRLPQLIPTSAENGWLAFSTDGPRPGATDDSTGSDIYVVRDGIEPTIIASRDGGTTRNVCPAFSPGGDRIAFGVVTAQSRSVVVGRIGVDPVLLDPTRLDVTRSGPAPCPRWSSDGTRLAYLDGETLVVRGLDGATLRPTAGDPRVEDFEPAGSGDPLLSPTGDRSVRVEADDAGCRLVIATPDGSAAEGVPMAFCPYAIPTWSPDGRQVLLMEDISGHDFAIHALTAERPFEIATVVASIRTNGARSWPGPGDVSWQGLQP